MLSVFVLCGTEIGRVECKGAAAALISGGGAATALSGSSTLSDWLEGRDTAGSEAGGNGAAGGEASSDLLVSTYKIKMFIFYFYIKCLNINHQKQIYQQGTDNQCMITKTTQQTGFYTVKNIHQIRVYLQILL